MTQKVDAFHRLHESGCFVMPNPWDVGSAIALERMGFEALATTSAGSAWAMGRPDNGLLRDEVLQHLRAIAGAVSVLAERPDPTVYVSPAAVTVQIPPSKPMHKIVERDGYGYITGVREEEIEA